MGRRSIFQSTRRAAYDAALATLAAAAVLFACSCSRKDLAAEVESQGYPGTCRQGPTKPGPTALRFRVSDAPVAFEDLFFGRQEFETRALGDFVVERRDGIASYQLAVVVDDAWQGVTRVVRGADLIASTPWQMELQDGARLAAAYLRTPAAGDRTGWKKAVEDPPFDTDSLLRADGGIPGPHFDPYAFIANPSPRAGPCTY